MVQAGAELNDIGDKINDVASAIYEIIDIGREIRNGNPIRSFIYFSMNQIHVIGIEGKQMLVAFEIGVQLNIKAPAVFLQHPRGDNGPNHLHRALVEGRIDKHFIKANTFRSLASHQITSPRRHEKNFILLASFGIKAIKTRSTGGDNGLTGILIFFSEGSLLQSRRDDHVVEHAPIERNIPRHVSMKNSMLQIYKGLIATRKISQQVKGPLPHWPEGETLQIGSKDKLAA